MIESTNYWHLINSMTWPCSTGHRGGDPGAGGASIGDAGLRRTIGNSTKSTSWLYVIWALARGDPWPVATVGHAGRANYWTSIKSMGLALLQWCAFKAPDTFYIAVSRG